DGDFPKDNDFEFDGKSHLELPRQFAPSAAGQRWLRAEGQFQTQAENGVILSHGDDEEGYSVHIQDGKLTFSHRSAGKAAVAQSEETVNDGKPRTFYSFRHPNGGLMLKLDGKEVGTAKGDGAFLKEPAESIQVGADTAKPVGAYQSPNRFVGRIWNLEVTYKR
ncbi:MAG: laminin G domain-containing protein, partial [Verrucomicrobiota bacterium]